MTTFDSNAGYSVMTSAEEEAAKTSASWMPLVYMLYGSFGFAMLGLVLWAIIHSFNN